MGSIGAPQPWPLSASKTPSSPPPSSSANNYNLRDCSQGICTVYCSQWCNPPPYLDPTVINNINNEDDDSSSTPISPLMVALISILASAFLLLSYYIIVFKYCKRRRQNRRNQDSDEEMRLDQLISDSTAASTTAAAAGGLDESFVRSITVFKYNKEDGLIEATECAVCLNEFNEEESLRLMPNCQHAFHIPCIDAWLKTHSSCPLCRAGMIDGGNSNNSAAAAAGNGNGNGNRQQGSGISSSGSVRPNNNQSVSAMQFQSRVRDVTVVLVGDSENRGRESTVQLELPASPVNFGRRGEGISGLGSQPRQQPTPPRQRPQQQQCRVTNEERKEEIQR